MNSFLSYCRNLYHRVTLYQLLLIIAFIGLVVYFETRYLLFDYALGGWSPVDWTNQVLKPGNFINDFQSGVANYKHSVIMWIYPFLQKQFGIPAMTTVYSMTALEIILIAVAFVILYNQLAPKNKEADRFAFLTLVVLCLASDARHANGARFTLPFWGGLFYSFADFLRIIGVVFVFKRRIPLAFLLLFGAYIIHPGMALHACLFALFVSLPNIKELLRQKKVIISALLFGVSVLIWTLKSFQGTSVNGAGIPIENWINLSRLMSFHWYPLSLEIFSTLSHETFYPLVASFVLALYVSSHFPMLKNSLYCGLGGIFIMTLFGWANAEIFENQTLIKLSLQRSTDFLHIIYLPLIIYFIAALLVSNAVYLGALGAALLASNFYLYGFPLLPSLAFVLLCHWHKKNENLPVFGKMLYFLSFLFLFCLAALKRPEYFLSVAVTGDNFFFHTWVILIALLLILLNFSKKFSNLPALGVLAVIAIFVLGVHWETKKSQTPEALALKSDYLAAQKWAQINTTPSAVFYVDPSITYGWRDFSERSSFGNFREWLHTSWLYDSKTESYQEGLRRFELLGIDLKKYLIPPVKQRGHDVLTLEVRNKFYSITPNFLRKIANENHIDFVVMNKQYMTHTYSWTIAFENNHFIVLKVN